MAKLLQVIAALFLFPVFAVRMPGRESRPVGNGK